MKLSDTQRAILTAAAQHPDHLAIPPERLPAGARQKVAQALLKQNLVTAVHRPAYDAITKWTVGGDAVLLKITDDGLRVIGVEPGEDEQSEAAIQRRNAERRAATEAATEAHPAPHGDEPPAPQREGTDAPQAAQEASQAPAEPAPPPQMPKHPPSRRHGPPGRLGRAWARRHGRRPRYPPSCPRRRARLGPA